MTPALGEWENELRTRDSHTKAVYIKRIPGKHVGLGNVFVMFLHIYAIILKTSAKSTSDVRSIVFSQSVLSDSPASSDFNGKWESRFECMDVYCILYSILCTISPATDSQTHITIFTGTAHLLSQQQPVRVPTYHRSPEAFPCCIATLPSSLSRTLH